ncbi:hypothetical protein [Planococcus lenghuensis]|uniref:Uncharacterized protein n=1 Tax=Planococcus lenghuensis TaxID=2213202 RepID=A0A1Q2L4H1_9BACL|nr:hypothetical protein [Planococcus lenghuensis]AQQ55274.1 hypothetical protein B0X71_19020 [Planococcus lenghuensis]
MALDLSKVDTSVIDSMAVTLAIFMFGTVIILTVLAGIMSRLRFPRIIMQPVITFAALGCLYYWAKYFL